MENDLLKIIEDRMPSFSKSQKKIAKAILYEYQDSAYITAARLGSMVGVSESTVVRFAYEMGFDGYPDFQRAVQKSVRAKMTPNQRIDATDQRLAGGDVLRSVMLSDIEKIKYTLETIDRHAFAKVVESIIGARRIYIIGVRSSATLASYLYYNLSLVFDNTKLVQATSTSEVFEQMMDIGERDVLFAITFPRYSAKILGASHFASAQGATVVALTDSAAAPITERATCYLCAQSDMASYVDSLAAPLSVLNAILVALVQRQKKEVKDRFLRLEEIWDQYNVYANQ